MESYGELKKIPAFFGGDLLPVGWEVLAAKEKKAGKIGRRRKIIFCFVEMQPILKL